jgi:pimeloyl-ACP methyl ester carboxylesterase
MRTALLAGYGLPAGRHDSLTPEDLAIQCLEQGILGSPTLVVALSAGCQIAAHLALAAPDRVTGLVLVGPTTDPRDATWPRLVRRWVQTARSEPMYQIPVLLRQYLRTGPLTMFRAMNQARHDRLDATLTRVGCPLLVIRGAHDDIARQDWTELLAHRARSDEEALRKSRCVTLHAGAHMVSYTHAPAVAREIRDFLQNHPRSEH